MKLISLNTWGGRYFEPLAEFIKSQASNTDIFCLQEIFSSSSEIKQYQNLLRANLLEELKNILPNFQVFYFPNLEGFDMKADPIDFELFFGQAIFVNNSLTVTSRRNYVIYQQEGFKILKKDFSNLTTPLQTLSFISNNQEYTIFNFHGSPFPSNKLDAESRIKETQRVKEVMDQFSSPKIIVGDFNLLPQTNCIKMYEGDMRNLIKEFNIERTRSNLSPFYGKPDFQKFADYTFVSKDINVLGFEVPLVEISDHLPMILQFS